MVESASTRWPRCGRSTRRSTPSTTTPSRRTGYEGLVKAYVGDGFAADFYREVAAFVDADTRDLVHEVLADEGLHAYIVDQVRAGIETTRGWPAGWRSGGGGWSGRRWVRLSGSPPTGTP